MSPTAAILIRISDLAGCGGGIGAGIAGSAGGSGSGAGAGSGGGVAQPPSTAAITRNVTHLVTKANPEHVDLRGPQPAAQHVEFVEVFRWSDVDAMVVAVVDLYALDV